MIRCAVDSANTGQRLELRCRAVLRFTGAAGEAMLFRNGGPRSAAMAAAAGRFSERHRPRVIVSSCSKGTRSLVPATLGRARSGVGAIPGPPGRAITSQPRGQLSGWQAALKNEKARVVGGCHVAREGLRNGNRGLRKTLPGRHSDNAVAGCSGTVDPRQREPVTNQKAGTANS